MKTNTEDLNLDRHGDLGSTVWKRTETPQIRSIKWEFRKHVKNASESPTQKGFVHGRWRLPTMCFDSNCHVTVLVLSTTMF